MSCPGGRGPHDDGVIEFPPSPLETPPPASAAGEDATRREFLQKVACLGLGGCALLGPVVAGAVIVAHPLVEKRGQGMMIRLAGLGDLPVGGAPQLYQVLAEPSEAWMKFSRRAVGAVFLFRISDREVRAFNASCPHVSGQVAWRSEKQDFFCSLHESRFGLDGARLSEDSPSPRDLDALDVELRGEEVWVNFQNFTPNTSQKIPA